VVRDKLVELGIRQNEPFAICRAERREGNRRFVDWVVQPDGSVAPVQSATAHSDTPGSPVNGDNGARVRPNGNGNGKAASAPTKSETAERALRAALTASIDAALAAEQYASAHGLSIRVGREDLRAMALSLFIQHARDGGVR
jgi:hypothetical protein